MLTLSGRPSALVPKYADRGVMRAGGPRHAIRSSNVFVTELYCGRQVSSIIRLSDSQRALPLGCEGCKRGVEAVGWD